MATEERMSAEEIVEVWEIVDEALADNQAQNEDNEFNNP